MLRLKAEAMHDFHLLCTFTRDRLAPWKASISVATVNSCRCQSRIWWTAPSAGETTDVTAD